MGTEREEGVGTRALRVPLFCIISHSQWKRLLLVCLGLTMWSSTSFLQPTKLPEETFDLKSTARSRGKHSSYRPTSSAVTYD